MNGPLPHVLSELVLVLGAAALTSLLFKALRLPVVLGYILAGLLIGPHVLLSVSADARLVSTLSELGVILLFFTIGLEFSVRTIARVGLVTLTTVAVELSLTGSLMYGLGRALGWTGTEALFAAVGAVIASTMLVVKGLEEHRVSGDALTMILGMMVVEDLLSIALLAVLTGVASGAGLSPAQLASTLGRLAGFLVAMVTLGMLIVPRGIRLVSRTRSKETLLIVSLAACFAMVWLAERAGFSIALGAFLGGALIAESGCGPEVDGLTRPFRDLFAAVFFVSTGMMIDPAQVARHWFLSVALAVALVLGKSLAVTLAAFFTGHGLRRSVQAGLSLSQIGEFAFIVAAVGIRAGVARDFLMPVLVGAACLTAISGFWQVRDAARVACWIDAHLPRPVATFVSFYESWIARLRVATAPDVLWRRVRRAVVVMLVDAALVAGVLVALAARPQVIPWIVRHSVLGWASASTALNVAALLAAAPFALGVIRCAIKIAQLVAVEVVPMKAGDGPDLGRTPRRALVLTVELVILLALGVPLAAASHALVPGGAAIVLTAIAFMVIATRRSITDFDGHVRAGSELIVEFLARQGSDPHPHALPEIGALLPGFEGLTSVPLSAGCASVGRSLADLDLRARTGASVLAIHRSGGALTNPSPREPLRAGDVLALAGSPEAVEAARALLQSGDALAAASQRVGD